MMKSFQTPAGKYNLRGRRQLTKRRWRWERQQ